MMVTFQGPDLEDVARNLDISSEDDDNDSDNDEDEDTEDEDEKTTPVQQQR